LERLEHGDKRNNQIVRRKAPKKNYCGPKNGNETRFFQKKHFVLPLQLIYVVSDQTLHCHRVVMKNFLGDIILLYTKKSNKNGELIMRNL